MGGPWQRPSGHPETKEGDLCEPLAIAEEPDIPRGLVLSVHITQKALGVLRQSRHTSVRHHLLGRP